MKEARAGHRLGPIARVMIALLVPRELREAFEGDLVEEVEARRRSGLPSRGWVARQMLRSAPAMLRLRARERCARNDAVGLAVATIFTGVGVGWTVGLFTAPPLAQAGMWAGLAAVTAAFFASGTARLATLAGGTALMLAGQAAAGGALGEGVFLLYATVGAMHSLDDRGGRRCARRHERGT